MRRPGGFTLLETVLALAITSILLAGLAPLLTRANHRAREQETAAALRAIKDAIAGTADGAPGFLATMGRLPRSLDELLTADPSGRAGLGGVPVGWVGPYLVSGAPAPLKDGWGRPFVLEGCGAGWRLRSLGPDGARSAEDDLVLPPQGCFPTTGTLRLEILRDAGAALGVPAGALSATLYAAVDGHETALPGTVSANSVSFYCGGAECQIPLGAHAAAVQLDKGPAFVRTVTVSRAVNSASLAFPFP